MKTMILTPESKQELKSALTNRFGEYSLFAGNIQKEDKYVNVSYSFNRSKISIRITYWKDGGIAAKPASFCSTSTGAINKIAKFLNLK